MQTLIDIISDLQFITSRGFYQPDPVSSLIAGLRSAQLFDFAFYPDYESIYFATECVNEGVFAPPYETSFFTWPEVDRFRNGFSAALVSLAPDEKFFRAFCFSKNPSMDAPWWSIHVCFGIPLLGNPSFTPHTCDSMFHPKGKKIEGVREGYYGTESIEPFLTDWGKSVYMSRNEQREDRIQTVQHFWESIRGLIIALNSKSVGSEIIRPSRQVRRAAERKGQWQPAEHRSVSLILPGTTYKSGDRIGTHASPRMHWRRGHFRRVDDRIIPVSPCIVGTGGNGVITHEYRAKLVTT